ncbi:beta-N-acetylhexosaminidase [Ferruginibacter sp. SUN106]|uniref:beta-N-acetylhexosaminidase n=1 Tax=Ferruginibacter sp. SUN106 TaxID=2978348 RepID=UPI003D36436B
MQKNYFLILCLLLSLKSFSQLNIVPMPAEVKMGKGNMLINPNTQIVVEGSNLEKCAAVLNDYLLARYGMKLKTVKKYSSSNSITLNYERLDNELPGAYNLTADKKGIYITGDNEEGVFYGVQTLLQLFESPDKSAAIVRIAPLAKIPYVSIQDHPRFAYRGMHLDVARHFFPVSFVKKYIDYLAAYKYNTFHWHLTDDQGWRIEIKKYPLLTQVGGCRAQTLIGRYGSDKYDGTKYCGYYTQEQIKEIVQYAADHYITVIPEIEMPGHGMAALASYPFLGCTKGPYKTFETWGVIEDVFCAGNDSTFTFLQNVLDEVIKLFPSKYIHIGGDECPKERWKTCPLCQKRIKDNNLKDEHALQSYFINRMEKYLNSKGKNIIGWDEILEGGLAPNATVMSWRGEEGGIEAAQQNHDVIMTPGSHCYIDHAQSENEDSITIGGYLPLEKVYSYEPIPAVLNAAQAKHILGAQANLWTEYIGNTSKVEYMIFPRMIALSEVLWSPKEKRDWKNFESRLPAVFERLDKQKINYSKAYYDPKVSVTATIDFDGVNISVTSKQKKSMYYFGNKNESKFSLFTDSISTKIKTSGVYGIRLLGKMNPSIQGEKWGVAMLSPFNYLFSTDIPFHFNKATGKKITLATEPSKNYPGNGAFTLVDGVQNEKGLAKSNEFLGFAGKDLDAMIDLKTTSDISKITVHVMDQNGSWIYLPSAVEITYLPDSDLTPELIAAAPKETKIIDPIKDKGARTIVLEAKHGCRFVHVVVKNFGIIPSGNPGAGSAAWLFVDEIEVE